MASVQDMNSKVTGIVTEIERYAIHDGPGIRTVVFLKGCSLRCAWCCNPETQCSKGEVAFFQDVCIACHSCVKACPWKAISVNESGHFQTDWTLCDRYCYGTQSLPCEESCIPKARRIIGQSYTVDEVLKEVIRDRAFYDRTGGGLTVSGGEPLNQAGFVNDLFRAAKGQWIDTALETCGNGSWDSLATIVEWLDFLFFDLKTIDEQKHIQWTGVSNKQILGNAVKVSKLAHNKELPLVIRTPIIPGFNDSEEAVRAISDFVANRLVGVRQMELLPYHKLGRSKYTALGREYSLADTELIPEASMETLRDIVRQYGLDSVEY